MSFNLIPKYYTLYPEVQCSQYLYFHDEPYAYQLENIAYNVYEWVLFKEYNDYKYVCHSNDCIAAISYNDLIESFKNDHFMIIWIEKNCVEHLDNAHQKQNLDLILNLIGILKILSMKTIFYI